MDEYIQNIMKNGNNNSTNPNESSRSSQPSDHQHSVPQSYNTPSMAPNIPGMAPNVPGMAPNAPDQSGQPTVIESEWAFYALSGLMIWNIYNKYFKQSHTSNYAPGEKGGCPVDANLSLDF